MGFDPIPSRTLIVRLSFALSISTYSHDSLSSCNLNFVIPDLAITYIYIYQPIDIFPTIRHIFHGGGPIELFLVPASAPRLV